MDTLTRMRAFIDVVEAEGFSAAARKIGRSKALLSKYVRELEDELGALLLNRTTRQFSLTEAGHTYYSRAIRDRARGGQPGRRGARILRRRARPHKAVGAAHLRRCADRPVADRLRRGASRDRAGDPARRPLRRPGRGRLRPGHPHHPAGELVADRAPAVALHGQALRLAGSDREIRRAEAAAGPGAASPASSTPTAAGCPTGRSSARTARRSPCRSPAASR